MLALGSERSLMKTPRHAAEGAAPARTRTFARRLLLVLVALAFAAFAASALAGSYAAKGAFVITGSITNTDPVTTNPLYKTTRATCGNFVSNGQLTGNYHYKAYRFRNLSSVARCVTVSLAVSSGTAVAVGNNDVWVASQPGLNFYGTVGGLGAGQSGDFEYTVPADRTFDVVVYESIQGGGATYTLLVEGLGILQTGGGPTAAASLQSFRASSATKSVVVRWRTQSEQNTVAFNLYRGDGAKRVRLTRSGVPATGDARGHSYSYIDRHPQKGKPSHYWLQVVPQNGPRIMFGPALTAAR
jgi:hypothetical protein